MQSTYFASLSQRCCVGLLGFFIAANAVAASFEISGVRLEDKLTLGGSGLVLNGAGIRYKAFFKVYVAALYLDKRVDTPEQVFAAKGHKRMAFTMLRDIDANELGRAFFRGFEDNTPRADTLKMASHIYRLGQIFAEQKKLLAGDTFTIDWVPSTGMVITVKGKVQGEPFKDIEFYNALMRIWLGTQPAGWKLKEALLGLSSNQGF
jgi:Chalcone isomerase-like